MHTKLIHLKTKIERGGRISFVLPNDFPEGDAELLIVVRTKTERKIKRLGDLLTSEFFGIWKDREDISDSASYARELRERAWQRSLH